MSMTERISVDCGAVLFDMDGVLVDSSPIIERSWISWAKAHLIDERWLLSLIHGRTALETIKLSAPLLDPLEQWKILIAQEMNDRQSAPAYEGVREMLSNLPLRNWAVVTSAPRLIALRRLTDSFLPLPEILVTADDVAEGKPEPECYLAAAYALNIEVGKCLVFEDSLPGIEAAQAAGMKVVAIATTLPRNNLLAADYCIDAISQASISIVPSGVRVSLPGK